MLNYITSGNLNFPIFSSGLESIRYGAKTLISTINQYSYIIAQQDNDFKVALLESDVLLPDGVGIVVATKLLRGENIKKIAGADLHHYLLEKLNREGGSCFYLGSSHRTLSKISERLMVEYPAVKFAIHSPPFKAEFTDEDNAEMITAVNSFKPDVLFVGMTAPKQEKWAHRNKEKLDTKTICCIGAVFDFYAGTMERPNKILIDLGLEWFGRLMKEPKRMWRRYLYYGPAFVYMVLKEKIKQLYSQA